MKTLNQYIKEKLIINQRFDEKLIINQRFDEKLIINKNYSGINILAPRTFDELREIIDDRDDKLGPGTKENPIDFNDIDVSHIRSFCNDVGNGGIFDNTFFKYIDISGWDVSNVTNMRCMFFSCEGLKSVGDISGWNVSKVTDMAYMFCDCYYLNQDISDWDVSSVTNMALMFCNCEYFNQNISNWNVSSVKDMTSMFCHCKHFNQDISKWNVSSVTDTDDIFYDCSIKEEYKPKFK